MHELELKAAEWNVKSILSSIWDIEDHGSLTPDNPSLLLARTLKQIL